MGRYYGELDLGPPPYDVYDKYVRRSRQRDVPERVKVDAPKPLSDGEPPYGRGVFLIERYASAWHQALPVGLVGYVPGKLHWEEDQLNAWEIDKMCLVDFPSRRRVLVPRRLLALG